MKELTLTFPLSKRCREIMVRRKDQHWSQRGEDGVLKWMVSWLPDKNHHCVEFGAMDGPTLSNTWHLVSDCGFHGCFIEGDADKFRELRKNVSQFDGCRNAAPVCLNAWVGWEGPDRLDCLLSSVDWPAEFDLLSIDIDGADHQVWEAVREYRPRIVIVEVNQNDPPHHRYVHRPGGPFVNGVTGTSFASMTELAHRKGYALVCNVSCNAIYVLRELLPLYCDREPTPAEAWTYEHWTEAEFVRRMLTDDPRNEWNVPL